MFCPKIRPRCTSYFSGQQIAMGRKTCIAHPNYAPTVITRGAPIPQFNKQFLAPAYNLHMCSFVVGHETRQHLHSWLIPYFFPFCRYICSGALQGTKTHKVGSFLFGVEERGAQLTQRTENMSTCSKLHSPNILYQ